MGEKNRMFGVCGYAGQDVSQPATMPQTQYVSDIPDNTDQPLTFYSRTKEWLCPHHLKIRKREKFAAAKMKKSQQEQDMWNRIRGV